MSRIIFISQNQLKTSFWISCCVIATLLLFTYSAFALDIYPWGDADFDERVDDLLDSMRKNTHLSVYTDILEKTPLTDGGHLLIKNLEGNTFSASLLSSDVPHSEYESLIRNAPALANILNEHCTVMAANYWNYEWCHR